MEQKHAVTKWECKVELVQTAKEPDEDEISAFQDRLNRLGDEGWEISPSQFRFVLLKRPKDRPL